MLKDKVIIVTGGSGLLGKAMVSDIRQKGGIPINFDVSVKDDLDVGTLYCDITNPESGKAAIQEVAAHFGHIDGLVNNAYPRTKDFGTPFEQMYEPQKCNLYL